MVAKFESSSNGSSTFRANIPGIVKDGIFAINENGLAVPRDYDEEVKAQLDKGAEGVKGALNTYEGFTKLQIEVNGETREIYLENENLRVDSSDWGEKIIGGVKVKINPEGDIIEYLDGAEAGEQLFSLQAAKREAKKLGKRLPSIHNENEEFQAILKEIEPSEFTKLFPGCWYPGGNDLCFRGNNAFFWASTDGDNAYHMIFGKLNPGQIYWIAKSDGLSVRCVKD